MRGAALIPAFGLALALAGCAVPDPAAAPDSAAPDAALPEGVAPEDVYTRQPDPREEACSYYRVEGMEVLIGCYR